MRGRESVLDDRDAGEAHGSAAVAEARRVLTIQREALDELIAGLDGALAEPFARAARLLHRATVGPGGATGRVIVSGVGKSGIIARKIAATLASTGTPAHFVHAGEASHGDLGMIGPGDVVLLLSHSGETAELKDMIAYAARFAIPLVALTGNPAGTLARTADVALLYPRFREACPHGLAPTTSTLLQLAAGDALAMALVRERGFSPEDFRIFHPGGRLGAQLASVREVMHAEAELPLVSPATRMSDAILVMTSRSFGCVGVVDEAGCLAGLVTDGDLRRNMSPGLLDREVAQVMTRDPLRIAPGELASAALAVMNARRITSLFVVEDDRPVGIVHIHDLLRFGVK